MSVVLGLNGHPGTSHDGGAALVVDGRVAVAVEEERLCRIRHAPRRAPARAAAEVLDVAGVKVGDLDAVAFPWHPEAMGTPPATLAADIRSILSEATGAEAIAIPEAHFVEHHVAHAWCGLLYLAAPPRPGERVAVLVVDGRGESTAGAAFVYDGLTLVKLWNIDERASLGIYYEALTRFLSFGWGEEGKTMGLASYGRPSTMPVPPLDDLRFGGDELPIGPVFGSAAGEHYRCLRQRVMAEYAELYGPGLTFNQRADLALAGQQAVEARLVGWVEDLLAERDIAALVVAGGVALNCTVNATIAQRCAERGVVAAFPPPGGDTGIAMGAAKAVAGGEVGGTGPYLGRPTADDEAVHALACLGATPVRASAGDVADRLAAGEVGAWFMGGSEVGPRALGHRCVIARADSERLRDRVNFLKGREPWRPLAPSVTPEEFRRSFRGTPSPYMLVASDIDKDAAERLAGVRHVDGSARPQVITEQDAYLALVRAMGERTGTEAIVCTSLNQAGSPLVYSVDTALEAARAMRLDFLAGPGWVVAL